MDVIDQYHANLRLADTACPTWFEYEGQSYWFANCETQTGAEFDGYLFSYVYEQEDIYGNGDIWDMDQLLGMRPSLILKTVGFTLVGPPHMVK